MNDIIWAIIIMIILAIVPIMEKLTGFSATAKHIVSDEDYKIIEDAKNK